MEVASDQTGQVYTLEKAGFLRRLTRKGSGAKRRSLEEKDEPERAH